MAGLQDGELLRRARAGDGSAFQELLRAYAAPLYDFAARLTRDREESFEVLRETFSVASHRLDRAPESGFAEWLFAIARANALAIVDGEPRDDLALTGGGLPPQPLDRLDEEAFAGDAELAAALAPIAWEAVAGLDARQASFLLAQYRGGLRPETLAHAFGVSQENSSLVVERLDAVTEDTAWALLALRDPHWRCPELEASLEGVDPDDELTPDLRQRIARHVGSCPICSTRRAQTPRLLDVFAALAPATLSGTELAELEAALAGPVAPAMEAAPIAVAASPVAPLPRTVRVLAVFAGLTGVASVLGGLLLVPSSPIALTRNRITADGQAAANLTQPPEIVFVTATPTPTIAGAAHTPPPRTPTSVKGGGQSTRTQTDQQVAGVPSATSTPKASVTATTTSTATPTPPPLSSGSPTPTPEGGCTPSLSTSVRQVDVSAGSSSFTVFNNYCRATQFSLDAGMNSPWLHLQQAFGTLAPGAFVTIGVSADVTTLPEGTTKGGMTLTWVDGSLQIPVVVTRNGSAPIVGPVTATCGQENQANFFSARVIDDYAVDTVTLDAIRPDGTTTVVPMALSSGTTAAGTFTAQVTGGVAVYSVTATDFAGHVGTWPKSAC